jgi:hypothetical protein
MQSARSRHTEFTAPAGVWKQTRDLGFKWQWWCIHYVKSAVPCCVRLYKVCYSCQYYLCHWNILSLLMNCRIWERQLDEEKDSIRWRRNSESRSMVLQEYASHQRQSWTIRSVFVRFVILFTYCAYFTYVPAFRINMWTLAKVRRFLSHRLCSRIRDDHPQGYAALDRESILHGNAGELGDYKELAVLPDKIARYLYEFHAECYASHGLPPLPDDRSNTNVHRILKPPEVTHLPLNMTYATYVADIYLCYLLFLWYLQNRALLDTLRKLRSTGGTGHFVLFNTLAARSTQTSCIFPLGLLP